MHKSEGLQYIRGRTVFFKTMNVHIAVSVAAPPPSKIWPLIKHGDDAFEYCCARYETLFILHASILH